MATQSDAGSRSKTIANGESVTRRLQQELMQLMRESDPNATAFPDGDNLFSWTASITGASGTVYEGLVFKLHISFPANYLFTAPIVRFKTRCFHPNVSENGDLCLDILKERWSSTLTIGTILQSIRSLLADPNNDSPLNGLAAQLWNNQEEYKRVLLKKYHDDDMKK